MSEAIKGLEPKILWEAFAEILTIPHASKQEAALRNHLKQKAEAAGLETRTDDAGNLVIRVPATPGHENGPTAVLQGHLDMVCTKNEGVLHNFDTDPISMVRDGDWIRAAGTTLGADNGVGMAAGLAVAFAPDLTHGPLEILLTAEEETGLTGAAGLDPGMLTGRILLNLDSEEHGFLYMGCAGGSGVNMALPHAWESPTADLAGLQIEIRGLKGGHSGIDILLNLGNAIKLLARTLYAILASTSIRIGDFSAGDPKIDNQIPREGRVTLVLPRAELETAKAIIAGQELIFRNEFSRDPNLKMTVSEIALPGRVMSAESTLRIVDFLLAMPNGVHAMSREVAGLVETSCNAASVCIVGDEMRAVNSTRSSNADAIGAMNGEICAVARLAGARSELQDSYPGWQPNPNSKILNLVETVFEELFGKRPARAAIHAGLECGIIGEKFPGMDMVSFGPDIVNPHSPDEALKISSVEPFWRLLTKTLEKIAGNMA